MEDPTYEIRQYPKVVGYYNIAGMDFACYKPQSWLRQMAMLIVFGWRWRDVP